MPRRAAMGASPAPRGRAPSSWTGRASPTARDPRRACPTAASRTWPRTCARSSRSQARLQAAGLSVPRIHAQDLDRGFLLLEDLGDRVFATEVRTGAADQATLWRAATDALVALQDAARPAIAARRRQWRAPRLPPTTAAPWRSRRSCSSTGTGRRCAARPCRKPTAPSSSPCGPTSSTQLGKMPPGLGAARLPLAQSAVAAGAGRHRARRHHRLPGRHARPGRLRPRLAAAGCARRRGTRARSATVRPLLCRRRRARAGSIATLSPSPTPRSAPSATPRSSASSRGSPSATANPAICATSRGSGAISSGISRIRELAALKRWYDRNLPADARGDLAA